MGVRAVLAAATLVVALTRPGLAAEPPAEAAPAIPEVPACDCPSPEPPNEDMPYEHFFNGCYDLEAKKLLGWLHVTGQLKNEEATIDIRSPIDRQVAGFYPGGMIDFDYTGAEVPVRVSGWFNGQEGYICINDLIDNEWVTEMRRIEIKKWKEVDGGYNLRFDIQGLPFTVKLKMRPCNPVIAAGPDYAQ